MDDDLNTAVGLGLIFDSVRDINRLMDSSAAIAEMKPQLIEKRTDLLDCSKVLGLLEEGPSKFFEQIIKRPSDIDTEEIESMMQERDKARRARDWARADAIREELSKRGIILEDGPTGTKWRFMIERTIESVRKEGS